MKYPCETIRDLLPLYHDKVCSAESERIVAEHLSECPDCAKTYGELCGADRLDAEVYDEAVAERIAESYRAVKKKRRKKVWTIIGIAAGAYIASRILILLVAVVLIMTDSVLAKPEVHTDIADYVYCRSGEQARGNFTGKFLDESIWPEKIGEAMNVLDYKMIYYNPWDAQYLGYLVVDFTNEYAYQAELDRLGGCGIDDYVGVYSVTGFTKYRLLALETDYEENGGLSHGFVYAMTDDNGKIIYVEMMFCNGFMDLKYEKYVPPEYLPDGFIAKSSLLG